MPQSAVELVKALLANPTDDENLAKLVSPTATYISLCYSNPALKKLMPYAGLHEKEGPAAVKFTFETVGKIWVNEHFEILAIFSDEKEERAEGPVNVAVFGKFTYRSTVLGKRYTSPFSFWCQVDLQAGQIVQMQFMEDTFGTGAVFEKDGSKTYEVDAGKEFVIGTAGANVNEGS